MAEKPFLGVPEGKVYVENPDGCYQGSYQRHNLYDTGRLAQPVIPGDYDRNDQVAQTTQPRPETTR